MFYFDGEEGRIKAETMEIAVSLICQLSSSNEHYGRMKKQVDRVIHRHEILFTGMLRKLDSLSQCIAQDRPNRQDILDDHLCRDLTRIFDSLIGENQVTWGKIITILAFSTFIAQAHSDIADRIAHLTGQYMVKRLIGWIQEHGGWVREPTIVTVERDECSCLDKSGFGGITLRNGSVELFVPLRRFMPGFKSSRSFSCFALVTVVNLLGFDFIILGMNKENHLERTLFDIHSLFKSYRKAPPLCSVIYNEANGYSSALCLHARGSSVPSIGAFIVWCGWMNE